MRAGLPLIAAAALIASGAAVAGDTSRSSGAGAPGDKMICKRFVKTGSLVDSYKSCKTKKEWDREHENLQHLDVADSCRNRAGGGGCGTT